MLKILNDFETKMKYLMGCQMEYFVDSGMKLKRVLGGFFLTRLYCFSLGNLESPGNKGNIVPTARYHTSNL